MKVRRAAPGLLAVALTAVLWDLSSGQFDPLVRRPVEEAARTLKLRVDVQPVPVRTAQDIAGAFVALAGQRAAALWVYMGTGVTYGAREEIARIALSRRVPTIAYFRAIPEAGGLPSYGPDLVDIYYRAAACVDRILKGAKPADMPVEQPAKFELVVNRKTSKALGLTIPQSVLLRADTVID